MNLKKWICLSIIVIIILSISLVSCLYTLYGTKQEAEFLRESIDQRFAVRLIELEELFSKDLSEDYNYNQAVAGAAGIRMLVDLTSYEEKNDLLDIVFEQFYVMMREKKHYVKEHAEEIRLTISSLNRNPL